MYAGGVLFLSSSFNPKFPPTTTTASITTFNSKPIHCSKPLKSTAFSSNSTNTSLTNPGISISILSSNPFFQSNKPPTAPWMKREPIPSQPSDLSKVNPNNHSTDDNRHDKSERALTDKVSGGRGKQAMRKIFEGIQKLKQKTDYSEEKEKKIDEFEFGVSFEEIGKSRVIKKLPWVQDERVVFRRTKKEKVSTAAELNLDKMLLERLRNEASGIRKWVKVMKAGITQEVVNEIRFIWRRNELVMLKFHMPLCRNMDRAQEIVEVKTGGLVVWNKKDTLVVYRGSNYRFTSRTFTNIHQVKPCESTFNLKLMKQNGEKTNIPNGRFMDEIIDSQPINGSLYEREADRLLDGLGPRFIDWWMPKPLPVDADILPEVVPGYKSPFRLCPSNGTSKLTDGELTYLRKLVCPLPTHFVLGRNRKLQGLAAAILKLWEKSYFVKIAIKWGVQNTSNKDMAYELKRLTGGDLLLRNKFFIIFYRGKDFLPCRAANLIAERDSELNVVYLHEEYARRKASEALSLTFEKEETVSSIGTLSEFQSMQNHFLDLQTETKDTIHLEAEKEKIEKELRNQERKLSILEAKIERSAKELLNLNSSWSRCEIEADQGFVTEEDRECLRKIALKMSSNLLLGRRGVFDGVMEGIFQHWKHREVVKVITMQRAFSQVIYTAKLIETESGGILISIEKLKKEGHAIIIYRGKNYSRPSIFATKNLLTKRKALQRCLEMQRIGSLNYFAYQRQREISELKFKLEDVENRIEEEA